MEQDKMEQLQVHDPNNGQWYISGKNTRRCDIANGTFFMGDDGYIYRSRGNAMEKRRYVTLAPCDPPLAMTLGEQLLESVPDKYRNRVVAFRPTNLHDAAYWLDGDLYDSPPYSHTKDSPRIILSPPPPEPKTDRDWLEELTDELEGYVSTTQWKRLKTIVDGSKHHLTNTTQQV